MAKQRVTWAALEACLTGRSGWRRRGREWHGPCPISAVGTDTCWFAAGAVDAVRGGCRQCGGRLESRDLAEHLAALGAREWTAGAVALRSPRPARRPVRRLEPAAAMLPAAVWRAAVALERPALAYLSRRLGCEPIVPAALRWLPAAVAAAIPPDGEGRRPVVPGDAVGALAYLFAGAGDSSAAAAVQLEAVDADGRRVPWGRDAVKRWSVPGSDFAGGARVFVAAPGRPACGAWLCEGPLDALAVAVRERVCGVPFIEGAAVIQRRRKRLLHCCSDSLSAAKHTDLARPYVPTPLERRRGSGRGALTGRPPSPSKRKTAGSVRGLALAAGGRFGGVSGVSRCDAGRDAGRVNR